MKRMLILIAVTALSLGACAADGGDSDTEEPGSLPVNDVVASSPVGEEPIPVEPNEGIGDGAQPLDLPVVSPDLAEEVEAALSDLQERLGDDRVVEVVVAHELTWPDGSLGCAQPDMSYTQALVDGYRIEFADGAYRFVYHGATGSDPFLCVEGEEGSPELAEVDLAPIGLAPTTPPKEVEPTEDHGGPGGPPDE